MKKKIGFVAAAVLMLSVALFATACGGVTGKYKCDMTEMMGGDMLGDGVTITAVMELKSGGKGEMSYEIKGDVPAELKSTLDAMTVKVDFEYKVDGEKITITMAGQEGEGTIKDGTLTFEGMTFKK